MVRACCVLNCTSTSAMPSHTFPKNPQMREKWMNNLILKPHEENEIKKLRVCYKHFKESDYAGSFKFRRLIRAAVPLVVKTDTTQIHNIGEHQEQRIQQHQKAITMLQENVTQLQTDMEVISEKQQENLVHVQTNIQQISQVQVQMQSQHNDQVKEMMQRIETFEKQLCENSQARRPNLVEITRKNYLSPIAQKLYNNNIKLQAQKRRMKRIMNRMKQQNKMKGITLNKRKYKGQEDKTIKIREGFINMMLRNNDVPSQARRYTIEDKMFCLGIYRRSRSCYNFISKFLLCPSYNTLNTQLNCIPIDTGCNKIILKYLILSANKMDSKDLYIVLAWDEMVIQPALTYDSKSDKIIGFEDWGMKRTRRFADHAIVFYIRCLASGQQMPIGYGFCNSATSSIQLTRCVKSWIEHLQRCGFKPKATVCDQGGPNIATINALIQETRAQHLRHNNKHSPIENTFYIGQECIVPLYDYVHLQKGIRNNLLEKDLLLNKDAQLSERESQCASWTHIETAYEIDRKCFQRRRKMKKLTDNHILPHLIPKMKVKFAIQVLSHTVADFIDMILSLNKDGIVQTSNGTMTLSKNAAATKEALFLFDDLFDSFNGNSEQGLTSIITQESGHLTFWQEALHKLRKMEFIERKTYKSLKRNKPKCLINWRQTIQGAKCLWKMLQTCGFTKLNLKYLNQDPIENLFSQIRNHGHQNNNPTPYLFGTSFKALLTCNLTSKHSVSANCKEDEENFLPLLALLRTEEIENLQENETTVDCEQAVIPETSNMAHNLHIDPNKIINSVQKIRVDCTQCTAILEDRKITQMLENAVEIAEKRFSYFCHKTKVRCKLIEIISQEALPIGSFHCIDVHNIVLDTLARHFITEWCYLINKILRRQVNEDSHNNYMYYQAHRMSLKYCRKKVPSGKTTYLKQ